MKTKLFALDLVISGFTNTFLKDDAMTLPAFNRETASEFRLTGLAVHLKVYP